ncbi:helix-turn-helix transcriptional regulator [Candidatus Woesearchaeota archaeon]|nr:helix-turn-helix transcriptional regulator [Candidatus Woesearchaeota archaeon]
MLIDPMVIDILNILGKKWAGHVLVFMAINSECSFTSIKKNLRVTSRALSSKLRLLEAYGLVEKTIMENPRRISYRLSENGKRAYEIIIRFFDLRRSDS